MKGAKIVNGYDMLIYQAEKSWSIWNETNYFFFCTLEG